MSAPKLIWVEPGMPGYTDVPCKGYTKRYTRADAPELVALVEAVRDLDGFMRCDKAYERSGYGPKLRAALAAYEGMGK